MNAVPQQGVNRLERPGANPRLETIQEKLGSLGRALELTAIAVQIGEKPATALLSPQGIRDTADCK